jgi:hypothetical protein
MFLHPALFCSVCRLIEEHEAYYKLFGNILLWKSALPIIFVQEGKVEKRVSIIIVLA